VVDVYAVFFPPGPLPDPLHLHPQGEQAMNVNELRAWRRLWGWTAVVISAMAAVCVVVTVLAPRPGVSIAMGVVGAASMLSLAAWAHFSRAVERAEDDGAS
jgi:Flp pilus assembly protein TadB